METTASTTTEHQSFFYFFFYYYHLIIITSISSFVMQRTNFMLYLYSFQFPLLQGQSG